MSQDIPRRSDCYHIFAVSHGIDRKVTTFQIFRQI